MTRVTIEFPVKSKLPGTPYSATIGDMSFTFEIDAPITSKRSALVAASFFREEFLELTRKERVSSTMQVLDEPDCECWIPTCYLDRCVSAKADGVTLPD